MSHPHRTPSPLCEKRSFRLYDISVPLWVLLLTPKAWLAALPAGFVVETAVIFIAIMLILRSRVEQSEYERLYSESADPSDGSGASDEGGLDGENDGAPARIRPTVVLTDEEKVTARRFAFRQWKRCILPVWLTGFLGGLIGGGFMMFWGVVPELIFGGTGFADSWGERVTTAIAANPFSNVFALVFTLAGILAAGYFSYSVNLRFSLRRLELSDAERRRLALDLAIFTAPYIMLIPSEWFW